VRVAKSFICSCCLNPVTSAGRTSVDIGASAKLELVDKFCYLGDMLSVDGDAAAVVEARIRIGWNKFRQLVPLLTNKDVSLIMRGRLYCSCARSINCSDDCFRTCVPTISDIFSNADDSLFKTILKNCLSCSVSIFTTKPVSTLSSYATPT